MGHITLTVVCMQHGPRTCHIKPAWNDSKYSSTQIYYIERLTSHHALPVMLKMTLASLVLRSTTFVSSSLLIVLGVGVLATSIDASTRLERNFPTGRYGVYYGPLNADWETTNASTQVATKMIDVDYDYALEKFSWAAAAACVAVGLLSMGTEVARLFDGGKVRRLLRCPPDIRWEVN